MQTVNSPSINAKLKAMYAKKLKKEDFEDLIKQNSIKEAVLILKTKIEELENLSTDITRIELEKAFDNMISNDINKIDKFLHGNSKKIWKQYVLKYQIKEANQKKYYEELLKIVEGNNKQIENEIKLEIDLLNILSSYRAKLYYGIENDDILINSFYKIDKEKLEKIRNSKSIDEIKEILKETIYKDIIKEDMERDFKHFLYNKFKKDFRNEILDLSVVISYFNILEIEKSNIITIIEGIRYKLTSQEIEKKLIL